MSRRLGTALARLIETLPGDAKFVLIEGVDEELAGFVAEAWQNGDGPALAIASSSPARFGEYALTGASGTGLRNSHDEGLCLVVCEGAQLADRQSVRSFKNVAPGELLVSQDRLGLLASAQPPVPADGSIRHIRQAILQAGVADRPSAAAVSAYFDRCAAGEDPLKALPTIGAFADHAEGGRIDAPRISGNLVLANRRRSDELLTAAGLADVRRRATRVLRRRSDVGAAEAEIEADRLMSLLETGTMHCSQH